MCTEPVGVQCIFCNHFPCLSVLCQWAQSMHICLAPVPCVVHPFSAWFFSPPGWLTCSWLKHCLCAPDTWFCNSFVIPFFKLFLSVIWRFWMIAENTMLSSLSEVQLFELNGNRTDFNSLNSVELGRGTMSGGVVAQWWVRCLASGGSQVRILP